MFSMQEENRGTTGRRWFLASGGALAAFAAWRFLTRDQAVHVQAATEGSVPPKSVEIVEFADDGTRKSTITRDHISKTEAEWRKLLTPDSFEVTRHAATESPYFNENPNQHARGIFRCVCCETALFNADTKFESGTGWPSFWAAIAKENVAETVDSSLGEVRTAVSCRLCDAHLGHVFDDGPPPTGLRYCMNSVAMRFAKAA